jgi:hypothetical protein
MVTGDLIHWPFLIAGLVVGIWAANIITNR